MDGMSDTFQQVALISGGGAGHEPMHGGFVGQGADSMCFGAAFL